MLKITGINPRSHQWKNSKAAVLDGVRLFRYHCLHCITLVTLYFSLELMKATNKDSSIRKVW